MCQLFREGVIEAEINSFLTDFSARNYASSEAIKTKYAKPHTSKEKSCGGVEGKKGDAGWYSVL